MSQPSYAISAGRRRIVTAVVMMATLMVVLDSTIANVALPHMRASLQASPETISWVLTSYIIASAVAMPLTGWLSDRIGRRELFTFAVIGFTLSSMLCGAANSLELMVAARIAQGLFGAVIAPMSQAIMYDIYPPNRHAQAMTIWGAGIMIGPILGPLIGGTITDALNWRWVFFINVPIGIVAAAGSWLLIAHSDRLRRAFDLTGFLLFGASLCALQLMLDRGPQLDWFESAEIMIELGVACAALWMYVIHSLHVRSPLIPLGIFADRNAAAGLVMSFVLGGIMMAAAVLLAPMLQTLMGYPPQDAGLLVAPRGVGTMIAMLMVGRIVDKVDPRLLVAIGFGIMAASLYWMTAFDLQMGSNIIMLSGFVQGVGMGMSLLPINLLSFSTLRPELRTDAASLMALTRSVGGSIMISVMMAMLARNVQVSHEDMAGTLALPGAAALLSGLGDAGALLAMLDAEVNRQAMMIAYINDYWVMMWVTLAAIPLVLLLRRGKAGEPVPHVAME